MNFSYTSRYKVSIAGQVVDIATKRTMSDVIVTLSAMPAAFKKRMEWWLRFFGDNAVYTNHRPDQARTRADGLFFFANLPGGDYELSAKAPSYGPRYGQVKQTLTVSEDPGDAAKPSWTSLELPPTLVRGSVMSQKAAVTLAEICIQGSGERTFSDSQGKYTILGIEPGKGRTLLVAAQGFRAASKPLVLRSAGDAATVDFSLVRAPG